MLTKIDVCNNELNIPKYDNPLFKRCGESIDLSDVDVAEFKGGYALQDKDITKKLKEYTKDGLTDIFVADGKHFIQEEYKTVFRDWIGSTKLNTVHGLDLYPHASITNGTSEAFQMFMMRHNNRRFKIATGDFMMHKIACNTMNLDWEWLSEHNSLEPGDALIISCPFSDTGCKHIELTDFLLTATRMDIPVLIDMAYFGMCSNINIDLSHKCIEEVTFSLGKTFPVIGARAGIRFQRDEIDDPVIFANQNGIVNNFACKIGVFCMLNWSPDYIPVKYYDAYYAMCLHNDLEVTNCVLFATSMDAKYESINRGNRRTRLCVSNFLLENYDYFAKNK